MKTFCVAAVDDNGEELETFISAEDSRHALMIFIEWIENDHLTPPEAHIYDLSPIDRAGVLFLEFLPHVKAVRNSDLTWQIAEQR